jgi:hypothetical protein
VKRTLDQWLTLFWRSEIITSFTNARSSAERVLKSCVIEPSLPAAAILAGKLFLAS